MKKILLTLAILLLPLSSSAQLSIPQGGTGQKSFPLNTLIATDGNTFTRFIATTTPTFGSFHATSTAATSTIRGNLKVSGNMEVTGASLFNLVSSGNIVSTGSVTATQFIANGSPASIFPYASTTGISSTGSAYFATAGGNVGIGTTSPVSKLSVVGETALGGGLTVGLSYAGQVAPVGGAIINGNVGIGTTGPGAKLEVLGTGGGADLSGKITGSLWLTGTYTSSSNPPLSITPTWNNGAGTQDAIFVNVTDTASLAASRLLEIEVGSATKFSVRKDGQVYILGNVGIGTTSPTSKLDVMGNGYFSSNLFVGGTITSTSTLAISGTGDNYILGNVGIGTTAPGAPLHVYKAGNVDVSYLQASSTNTNFFGAAGGNVVDFINSDLTTNNGAMLGFRDSTSASRAAAMGAVFTDHTNAYGDLFFGTRSASGFSEKMRILSTGNVGIGTTGPVNKLDVNGTMAIGSYAGVNTAPANSLIVSGTVGIGIVAPPGKLHVYNGAGGGSAANGSYDIVTLENNNIAYLNIIAPTNKSSGIIFSDDVRAAGGLVFDHSTNIMSFSGATGGYNFSSGNVGIGTTTPARLLNLTNSGLTSQLLFEDTGAVANSHYGTIGFSRGNFSINTNTDALATTTRLFIQNDGNVGIGTTGPSANLSIAGNSTIPAIDFPLIGTLNTFGPGNLSRIYATADGADWATTRLTIQTHLASTGNWTDTATFKAGNVGIGTTGPGYALDVQGSAATDAGFGNILPVYLMHNTPAIGFNIYYSGGFKFGKGSSSSYGNVVGNLSNGDLYFSTSNSGNADAAATLTTRMTIQQSGNVGIGTTSPQAKLTITNAGASNQLLFEDTGAASGSHYGSIGYSQGQFNFNVLTDAYATSSRMVINNQGNVGIGTTSPAYVLDVSPLSGVTSDLFRVASSTTGLGLVVKNNGNVGIGTVVPDNFLTVGTPLNSTTNIPGISLGAAASRFYSVGQDSTHNMQMGWVYNATAANAHAELATYGYSNPIKIDGSVIALQTQSSGNVGIGTTSPQWLLNPTSATAPQLALSAGAGLSQWAFRNAGGNLYLSTTTVAGTATTTPSAFSIIGSSGNMGVGTTSPWGKFSIFNSGLTAPSFVVATGTNQTALTVDSNGDTRPYGRLVLPMGEVNYFSTTGTLVSIATQSDGSTNMVKVAPTTTFSNDFEFDNGGANNGRLRYIGNTTRTFHVACTVSFDGEGVGTNVYVFGIAKNGTVLSTGKVLTSIAAVGDIESTALHVMVTLSPNDYLELYAGNTSDADDITAKAITLFAMGL